MATWLPNILATGYRFVCDHGIHIKFWKGFKEILEGLSFNVESMLNSNILPKGTVIYNSIECVSFRLQSGEAT